MKEPVIKLLDTIDRPPRQVEITAKMFEVSHDFDFQYGTQLLLQRLATDGTQSLASTFSTKSFANAVQNTATGGATDPAGAGNSGILRLMRVFQDAGVSVDVTFQLMAETGLINVVASPRMTVAAGQTGYMLAGQELPIQQVAIVNSAQQTSTTYKPVGVQLVYHAAGDGAGHGEAARDFNRVGGAGVQSGAEFEQRWAAEQAADQSDPGIARGSDFGDAGETDRRWCSAGCG
jgi:Flp pilus assembly secretin CpaC